MYRLVLNGFIIGWGDYETLKEKQAIYGGIIIESKISIPIERYNEIVNTVLTLDNDKG